MKQQPLRFTKKADSKLYGKELEPETAVVCMHDNSIAALRSLKDELVKDPGLLLLLLLQVLLLLLLATLP